MIAKSHLLRWELLLSAALLAASVTGCHKNQPALTDANNTGDPAEGNLAASDGSFSDNGAPVQQSGQPIASYPQAIGQRGVIAAPVRGRVLSARAQNESQQQAEEYGPQQGSSDIGGQGAPIERRAPEYTDGNGDNQAYTNGQNAGDYNSNDGGYNAGMDAVEEADQPPPQLPVYEQPPCPEPNYLWTPGYWNYAPAGYFWVPGAWIAPPYYGALWTPGYWGYYGHRYRFHHGFWGPHIGFYGGVAYGFGYTGYGYEGGYWRGNQFQYNRAVTRVNTTNITNVYNRTVIINNNTTVNRVSYNGGNGGLQVRPRPAELAVLRETRVPPMQSQVQLRQTSATNRQQFFTANGGRPATVVAARPLASTPGIPPPAVRLPSANAPHPDLTPGRPNLPTQQQANAPQTNGQGTQQHPNPQRLQQEGPLQPQRTNGQQPSVQQGLNTQPGQRDAQQQINARGQQAIPQQLTPQPQQRANQQRLDAQHSQGVQQVQTQHQRNSQQLADPQRVPPQQQIQQQRLNAQQQADQQRMNTQQQSNQQRANAQQQRIPNPQPGQAVVPQLQARPQIQPRPQPQPRPETASPQTQNYRSNTAPQRPAPVQQPRPAETRPEVQDRPQPSRTFSPQPIAPQTVRPIEPTGRPQYQPQTAPRPQYQPQPAARPQPQPAAPRSQAQPAPRAEEARPH